MILILEGNIPCNCNCAYCYQRNLQGNHYPPYDLDAVMKTAWQLHKEYPDELVVLHGGEPLLLPFDDIERILGETYQMQGHTTINTNGTLINEEIIKLFKRYKTSVALSFDGFYPLNSLRCYPNDQEKCKEYSEKLVKTIETLISEGIQVNIMMVLHKANATADKLNLLAESIIKLSQMGVKSGKINWCKLPYPNPYELTPDELFNAFKMIAKITLASPIEYSPIDCFLANLWGTSPPNDCFASMCDIFCTERAKVVRGDGSCGSCTCGFHINGNTERTTEPSYERYMALQKIPKADGGCKGCKYWNICYGGCPAVTGDWRLKDPYCLFYYRAYEFLEETIRNFEPIFQERFELATDKSQTPILKDEPVHRIIKKRHNDGIYKETTINGITQKEYPDHIEITYKGGA